LGKLRDGSGSISRSGKSVKEGDYVVVMSVHASVVKPLPEDEKEKNASMVGKVLKVYEVDEYGQAGVEMEWKNGPGETEIHSLGLAPEEMELVLS
jgi:hypothetical protein